MKKAIIPLVIIEILLFTLLVGSQTVELNNRTVFQNAQEGEKYVCQTADISEQGYLFVSDSKKRVESVKLDEGQNRYRVLGTVVLSKIYYQYQYIDKTNDKVYGIGSYDPGTEKKEMLGEWHPDEQEWIAFGGYDDTLCYVMRGKDGQLHEYIADLTSRKLVWFELRTIGEMQNNGIAGAFYEKNTLNVRMTDGTVYAYPHDSSEVQDLGEKVQTDYKVFVDKKVKSKCNRICVWIAVKQIIVGFLILSAFIILLLLGIILGKSLVIRMLSVLELALGIALIVCAGFFGNESQEQIYQEKIQTAQTYLNQFEIAQSDDDSMRYAAIRDMIEESDGLFDDVIVSRKVEKEIKILTSLYVPADVTVEDAYGTKLDQSIETALEKGNTQNVTLYANGQKTEALTVCQWNLGKSGYTVTGILSGKELNDKVLNRTEKMYKKMLIVFLVISFLVIALFAFYQYNWNTFLKTAHFVAMEKTAYKVPAGYNGGMRKMWGMLQEISTSMEMIEYEKQMGIRASFRFVPKGIERIFGKSNLSEVSIGDMCNIPGSMVRLSMEGINQYNGNEYMKIVNKSFELINEVREEKQGVLMNCDSDFLRNKFLFTEKPEQAVSFAVETSLAFNREPMLCDINKLFFIHTSKYYCGISGTSDQVVPFAYSQEDGVIDYYTYALRRAGVNIVMTENVINQIEERYSLRYIGYISTQKDGRNLKLYECLDAYFEEKRKLLLKTEESFQRALQLFYSDNFYLARNTFNEVLRMNPKDQIARWYLFNCEYYLNTAGENEVVYGLFENRILEQQYQIM